MSGFEIAGLVLGALPLIISAIEHYESNLDRAAAFFKWQDVLEKAIRELWIQHTSYEMTLRNLLVDLTSEAQLDELLSQPESPLWQSPELDQGLRDELGAAYHVYNYTIYEIGGYVRTLASHLDIDREDVVTSDDLEAILKANRPISGSQQQGHVRFEFRRRIKLTMRRRDIRQLLQGIRECNDRLDSFIAKAEKFEQAASPQMARKRNRSAFSMPLQQVYSHAAHLHQVLSEAWTCSVHPSHSVHLLLEHRIARKGRKKQQLRTCGGADSQDRDRATFTLAFKGAGNSATATWCLAEVKVLDEPVLPLRAGGIKFHVSPSSPTEKPCLSSSGPGNISSLEIVQDICSMYNFAGHFCLGFCLDLTAQSVLRGTYPAAQRPICLGNDLVTLEDILFSGHKKRQPLTDEDRYILAITLVASFLQLYKTPWFGDRWTERDICFFEEPLITTTNKVSTINTIGCQGKRVDIHHPFVTQTYKSAVNATSSPTGALPSESTIYSATGGRGAEQPLAHDDSVNLLILARLLLEIRSSRRIEHLRRCEDLGPDALPNEATDLQTLKRWIQQEKGNLSFAFRDAVKYCMKCFADPDTDLKDLAFRQSVIEGVVVPLLEELDYLQGRF